MDFEDLGVGTEELGVTNMELGVGEKERSTVVPNS
jgi:hypothetical protein